MECVLLGTGGMMPMPYRLLTSLAVRLNGQIYAFDAGEGTQIGWKSARLGVRGMRLFAITHLHADHCLGLPGLMMLRAQIEDPGPLTILGPPGIQEFVRQTLLTLEYYLNYPLHFLEWSGDHERPAYEDEQVRIFWHPLRHTRFCLGYRLEELERTGKFDPEKAKALGIPMGPLWRRLQRGESVPNASGEMVPPDRVLGPPRRGRHIAFVVDTRPAEGAHKLCKGADIAFLEGMFLPEHGEHAALKGHMTVAEAAAIARKAGAGQAVLVHISPRYQPGEIQALDACAREQFEHARVGRDLAVYTAPLPD